MKKIIYKALRADSRRADFQSSKKSRSMRQQKKSTYSRCYDSDFLASSSYLESLPDIMNTECPAASAGIAIQQVGISDFRAPLLISISNKLESVIEASITGVVSLKAHLRGINMSRIIRTFYRYTDKKFTTDTLASILIKIKGELQSEEARLKVSFSFPLRISSLRSNLSGYQYYDASFESGIDKHGVVRKFIELDFVYSSSCPCSSELAEHARTVRGIFSIPHSQRSKARIRIELNPDKSISLQQLRDKCLNALKTETQVIVKREDEQAFAELNGSNEKLVEDAARQLFMELNTDSRIRDFEIFCAHFESLHSHNAISALSKGIPGGMRAELATFRSIS